MVSISIPVYRISEELSPRHVTVVSEFVYGQADWSMAGGTGPVLSANAILEHAPL